MIHLRLYRATLIEGHRELFYPCNPILSVVVSLPKRYFLFVGEARKMAREKQRQKFMSQALSHNTSAAQLY